MPKWLSHHPDSNDALNLFWRMFLASKLMKIPKFVHVSVILTFDPLSAHFSSLRIRFSLERFYIYSLYTYDDWKYVYLLGRRHFYVRRQYDCRADEDKLGGLSEGSTAIEGQLRCHLDCAEGYQTLWCPQTSLKTNYDTKKDNTNTHLSTCKVTEQISTKQNICVFPIVLHTWSLKYVPISCICVVST